MSTPFVVSPRGKVLEGNVAFPHRWLAMTPDDAYREAPFLLGDDEVGPIARILSFPPGIKSVRSSGRAYSHHHRTDTFRIVLAPQPEQTRISGRWLGYGEFVLRQANDVYVETAGGRGLLMLLVSADRRGYHPVYAERDRHEAQSTRAETASVVFGTAQPSFHARDEDAVTGLVADFGSPARCESAVFGSVFDHSNWSAASDGSRVAPILMGDSAVGPAVVLSNNRPDSLESPERRTSTDEFRLILAGSCTIGERVYTAGEFRVTGSGTVEGPVRHGPGGSTQVVVLANRSEWRSSAGLVRVDECARLSELDEMIRRLEALLDGAHGVSM